LSALLLAYRIELLKLRRTLALSMVFVAPTMVVLLQVLIWLNNKRGFDAKIDLWLAFFGNVLTVWALFMQPLLAALVTGLVYHAESSATGWLRMGAWPLPRVAVPLAKLATVLTLMLLSTLVLTGGSLVGARLAATLHPLIALPDQVPWGKLAARVTSVTAASLLVVAIQNLVASRYSAVTVSLGTGVAGTFVALFASSWKLGIYYPWLMPLRSLLGTEAEVPLAIALGSVGGVLVGAASVLLAARRDPGLVQ
jgi:lantibiotic transport system permease protein